MAVIARDNVTGLIYAGGRATRMGGVDKGLELFRGRPLIEAVIDRLKPQCVSIVISANRNLERYAAWGYPVVRDLDDAFAGPLAALAAAGAQSVVMTEWVLTAPCDAPFFPEDLMERFRMAQERSLQEGRDPDAFIAKGERPQNAFACLRSKCLLSAGSFLALGRRRLGWCIRNCTPRRCRCPMKVLLPISIRSTNSRLQNNFLQTLDRSLKALHNSHPSLRRERRNKSEVQRS